MKIESGIFCKNLDAFPRYLSNLTNENFIASSLSQKNENKTSECNSRALFIIKRRLKRNEKLIFGSFVISISTKKIVGTIFFIQSSGEILDQKHLRL